MCLFPNCKFHPQKNGYCIGHRDYASGVSVNIPSEIPKQSNKTKEDNKRLKQEYAVYLSRPENKFCKVKFEGCTHIANVVHHVAGRIGEQKFNQADWMPSCPSCNILLESQDSKAREAGVKKSKFSPKQ